MRLDRTRMSRIRVAAVLVWAGASGLLWMMASSCGRSELLAPTEDDEFPTGDAGSPGIGSDSGASGIRMPPPPQDSGPTLDALAPIDVAVSPIDSSPPVACADAGSTLIYLISTDYRLFSYDPALGILTPIALLQCPAIRVCLPPLPPVIAYPFSMAVDQVGQAYIVYCDGELFQVSTADGHCTSTGFGMQGSFPGTFGMGFTAQGSTETLYVAGDTANDSILGSINTTNFSLDVIGSFVPAIQAPELTGTASGGLFGFYAVPSGGSGIAQIDPLTAVIVGNTPLPTVTQGNAWAFAFWGGDFYTFTSPLQAPWVGQHTRVQRYRPADGTTVDITTFADQIVGAGVSTCAPQR